MPRLSRAPPLRLHRLIQLEKKYGGVQLFADREGVLATPAGSEASNDVADEALLEDGGSRRAAINAHPKPKRKVDTNSQNPVYLQARREALEAVAARPSSYWIERNKADIKQIPNPLPRASLPEWYLATLPQPGEVAFNYSSQRLNAAEEQKRKLRTAMDGMDGKGHFVTYNCRFLHANAMGAVEAHVPYTKSQLPRWDNGMMPRRLHTGTVSRFEMLQPSGARIEDLGVSWGLEQREEDAKVEAYHLKRERTAKKRFDALPTRKPYLDENPHERFRSVFQQTEEQIAAEKLLRKEGAIESWRDKLVVDDPVLRINVRSRNTAPQTDRMTGILQDGAKKGSLRKLYRGEKSLTFGNNKREAPSIFMDESTQEGIAKFEDSLREVHRDRWSSTRLTGTAKDFTGGHIPPAESLLENTFEAKRSIAPLTQADYSRFASRG